VPPVGAERAPDSTGKSAISQTGGAESGAVGARNADSAAPSPTPTDPELARLVEAWPKLPEAIRRGILAMVESSLPAQ